MAAFTPGHVKIGVGSLYAAPLGTTEPTGVTGAWPAGWTLLGYTTQGSTFTFTPTLAPVTVEEEFWPLKNVITKYAGKLTFVFAETTKRNLVLAFNGSLGASANATMSGTGAGGSLWVEPPTPGKELRIMLGWDAQPEGATTGGTAGTTGWGRMICRQCIQGSAIKVVHRKGANKTSWSVSFELEKPAGKQPVRFWLAPTLAA